MFSNSCIIVHCCSVSLFQDQQTSYGRLKGFILKTQLLELLESDVSLFLHVIVTSPSYIWIGCAAESSCGAGREGAEDRLEGAHGPRSLHHPGGEL